MLRILISIATLMGFMFSPNSTSAKELQDWGVVVLPGKEGKAVQMAPVSSALTAAGAAVVTPTVSWGKQLATYSETLDEVAKHVASLRSKGAKRIAIVGQSLGANIALGYGAQRGDVQAIIAMAPGHFPERFIAKSGESLARAQQAVAAGRGKEIGSYFDTNQGQEFETRTTAEAYVSFFDPAGPAIISRNAAALKVSSLLWIIGTNDALAKAAASGGKIVTVPGGHGDTPKNGAKDVVAWLQSL